jgi:serine/threonine-protein kinase
MTPAWNTGDLPKPLALPERRRLPRGRRSGDAVTDRGKPARADIFGGLRNGGRVQWGKRHPPEEAAVIVHLTATAGPLFGRMLAFDRHDVFLLDRGKTLSLAAPDREKYISRTQFLIEINPPRCRVVDMGNPSGTFVNGKRVSAAELRHLDEIKGGNTYMRVEIPGASEGMPLGAGTGDAAAPPAGHTGPRGTPAIHGYRIEAELGRGPFGATYRAVREADGVAVAIKTYVPVAPPDVAQAKALLADAAHLRALDHPHVARLHALGAAHGLFWFETDLVNGPDLGRLVKERGQMDEKVAVRIILQVLAALEYAHANEVGHGDMKPSNVFLEEHDQKRTVKVADFGLARAFATSRVSGLTLTDHVDRAVEYTAPEQIAHFKELTAAIDQFRAAATLYRLLTDKPLYNPAPPAHPLALVLDGAIIPLRSRRPGLTPALAKVVETALAREPVDRYPDVTTFAEALLPFAK